MRRSYMALLTAALIFALTYLSAWVSMRDLDMMTLGHGNYMRLHANFYRLTENISEYVKKGGRYPDSFDELKQFLVKENNGEVDVGYLSRLFHDPWDRPYQYEKTDKGYRLWSLGRTGKPGSVGLDAEIEYDGKRFSLPRPTPYQFVFEGAGSRTLFFVALAASCAAGLIWYFGDKPRTRNHVLTWFMHDATPKELLWARIRLAAGLSITIAASVFVAFILTGLYLAMQQSGH